ncbi:MAG: RidA family protein [Desulfobulbaceae bacterium]|nr:RidA family protein [Desulfobulbaceae bacterium]
MTPKVLSTKQTPPARSTVQVAALPLGSNIEIEFILNIYFFYRD